MQLQEQKSNNKDSSRYDNLVEEKQKLKIECNSLRQENFSLREEVDGLKNQLEEISETHSSNLQKVQDELLKEREAAKLALQNADRVEKMYHELKEAISSPQSLVSSSDGMDTPSTGNTAVFFRLEELQGKCHDLQKRSEEIFSYISRIREMNHLDTSEERDELVLLSLTVADMEKLYKSQKDSDSKKLKELTFEIQEFKKSESILLSNGKKLEESYNSILDQLKRLQYDLRDSYQREENLQKDISKAQADLKKARDQAAMFEAQLRESKLFEENLNRQVSVVSNALSCNSQYN